MSLLDFRKHKGMSPEDLKTRLATLRHFSPSGFSEIVAFSAMAISAGICEELLYRGWLLHLIGASTGSIWIGLLLSSVAFGLGHAYQGPQGIFSTGFVGLLLGLIFVWVGSLIPVQILHAFINLSSGL
jgi:membrane protease YdiL (CAAX protease family)